MKQKISLAVLNQASGVFLTDLDCVQFVVNNPTAFVVKIRNGNMSTTDYDFIIKAQSMFVSPLFKFNTLYYVVDAIVPGYVMPIIYGYQRWVGTPGSTPLT